MHQNYRKHPVVYFVVSREKTLTNEICIFKCEKSSFSSLHFFLRHRDVVGGGGWGGVVSLPELLGFPV